MSENRSKVELPHLYLNPSQTPLLTYINWKGTAGGSIGGQGRPLWNKLPVTKGGVWHWPSQLASLYLTRQHWCQNGTLGLWYCGYFIIKLQYLNEPTSEINARTLWLPSQSQLCVLFCEGYMERLPESKSNKLSYKNCICIDKWKITIRDWGITL